MKRIIAVALLAFNLAGCAAIQNIEGAFNKATTTTVPSSYVNIALNTYGGLKATATSYGQYCIDNKFPRPVCSAGNRRSVIRFVRSGDGAVAALDANLDANQPLLSTTYNVLVGAINGLQASPISVAK